MSSIQDAATQPSHTIMPLGLQPRSRGHSSQHVGTAQQPLEHHCKHMARSTESSDSRQVAFKGLLLATQRGPHCAVQICA
jgi:hypothetical protein